MSDNITIVWHDSRDPSASTPWQQVVVPHRRGLAIKYYLQEQAGLIGQRARMSLRCFSAGSWQRVRMTHVPEAGDTIALAPKSW